MEGGDAQTATLLAVQQLADPLLHLPRRLIGEGDGGDGVGRIATLLNEVGDLAGDDAGFAATGTGKDEEGAINGSNGFPLAWVEIGAGGHEPVGSLKGRRVIIAAEAPKVQGSRGA